MLPNLIAPQACDALLQEEENEEGQSHQKYLKVEVGRLRVAHV